MGKYYRPSYALVVVFSRDIVQNTQPPHKHGAYIPGHNSVGGSRMVWAAGYGWEGVDGEIFHK